LTANLKRMAAQYALSLVQDGMVLGLGSGSTAHYFVELLGEALKTGQLQGVCAIPTSQTTASQAHELDIPLTTLAKEAQLDLIIDGADEVSPSLNLIKGLGRALLREKIVAIHARRFIVIVDETKLVKKLGSKDPLPVEIVPFEAAAHVRWLNSLGCRAELWCEADGSPVVTDNHNYLARCWFTPSIKDPYVLAENLAHRPGIVEHGLFLDMASEVVVAGENGVRVLERSLEAG
jgi:ribose 5-phosphate isomerase A